MVPPTPRDLDGEVEGRQPIDAGRLHHLALERIRQRTGELLADRTRPLRPDRLLDDVEGPLGLGEQLEPLDVDRLSDRAHRLTSKDS
jgi:hypothetical protein